MLMPSFAYWTLKLDWCTPFPVITPNGQFVSLRHDKCVARKKFGKGIMQNKGTILYLLRRRYQLFTVNGKTPAREIFSKLFLLYTQKSINILPLLYQII
jgi:hypothetical protein